MEKLKHTPGPWKLGKKTNSINEIQTESGWSIANVKRRSSGPRGLPEQLDRDEANARLISAAPELLEALLRARHRLNKLEEIGAKSESTLELVERAIAKATGGAE